MALKEQRRVKNTFLPRPINRALEALTKTHFTAKNNEKNNTKKSLNLIGFCLSWRPWRLGGEDCLDFC
jgi:hypothetical protein